MWLLHLSFSSPPTISYAATFTQCHVYPVPSTVPGPWDLGTMLCNPCLQFDGGDRQAHYKPECAGWGWGGLDHRCRALKGVLESVTLYLGCGMGVCDRAVTHELLFNRQILLHVLLSLSAVFETSKFSLPFAAGEQFLNLTVALRSSMAAATGWFSSWLRLDTFFSPPEVMFAGVWLKGWGGREAGPGSSKPGPWDHLFPSTPTPGSTGGLREVPMDTRGWEPLTVNACFSCFHVALATARPVGLVFVEGLTNADFYFHPLTVLLENPHPASDCYWIYLWADESGGCLRVLTCTGAIWLKNHILGSESYHAI